MIEAYSLQAKRSSYYNYINTVLYQLRTVQKILVML